eukprot:5885036-Pleurochrysis_carterae.AAC.2
MPYTGFSTRQMRGRPSDPMVRGDKVPSAHEHATSGSKGGESSQGGRSHGRAKRLVVIHAVCLRAALDAEASFQRATPFALIHPDESHERTSRRQLRSVDERPTARVRRPSSRLRLPLKLAYVYAGLWIPKKRLARSRGRVFRPKRRRVVCGGALRGEHLTEG